MKISVVIAARNAAALLPETLSGVTAQTWTDWELVVVEYGTRDGTALLVSGLTKRSLHVQYEFLEDVNTPAVARNRLLELAAGTAIAFLEPGDTWLPSHLTHAVQQLNAGGDVVISNARIAGPRIGSVPPEIVVPPQLITSPMRTLFVQDAVPCLSCVVVKRSTLDAAGKFDPRFSGGEARDLWLRCALTGARFVRTQRATCQCHTPPSNAARTLLSAQQASQFYEKHREVPLLPAALRRRLLANSLVAEGQLLRGVDPAKAARCFWRAWSLQPVQVQALGQFALTGFARPPSRQAAAEERHPPHPGRGES